VIDAANEHNMAMIFTGMRHFKHQGTKIMKVLVIGSGGREHALCWKISKSSLVDEVFCAPGNAGVAGDAVCIDISSSDISSIVKFAKANAIDLTVVGPEAPLVEGVVDAFESEGLKIFGPNKRAAALEGSKAFAKRVMRDCGIPTASFEIFDNARAARAFIEEADKPVVVKADGLAAGKGVIVASDKMDALRAVDRIMVEKAFGDAGKAVVVEERIFGEEASFIAISDGTDVIPMASSQDHKPVYDGDNGPNTGGMGAYSPAPLVDETVYARVMEYIMYPLVKGMKAMGAPYKGVIYAGLMVRDQMPYVLEFNVRMGDPETQPLLMRLKSDIVPVMLEVAGGGSIKGMELEWEGRSSVCVILASGGYPLVYEKGKVISGIKDAENTDSVKVFYAGAKSQGDKLVTSGGRVLGVTALGDNIETAIKKAYGAVEKINFDGMYYRTDIGQKALKRLL